MNTVRHQPLVTIAMPFYNSERTLALAIESLLTQTYQDFELLLCDDGSTDSGREVALSFNDFRIVLWSDGTHKALAARLNECLDRAKGLYFVRMDADDIAYPERIEKEIRFLQRHPEVDLVSTFAVLIDANGKAIGKMSGPTKHEELTRTPLNGFRMWHSTWAGRISWFQSYRYTPDCIVAQDLELLYRAHATSRYATIPEILLGYRQEALKLEKMVRYRWLAWRYVGWHLRGFIGLTQRVKLAALLLIKASADCVAVWSGLRYRLLRRRARPLTAAEIAEWCVVWGSVQDGANAKQSVGVQSR